MYMRALMHLIAVAGLAGLVLAKDPPPPDPAEPAPVETQPAEPEDAETRSELIKRLGTLGPLLAELDRLGEEVAEVRRQLAEARMQAASARQELEEMKLFMADHHEFGTDFEQYRAVKEAAGRDVATQERKERVAELTFSIQSNFSQQHVGIGAIERSDARKDASINNPRNRNSVVVYNKL